MPIVPAALWSARPAVKKILLVKTSSLGDVVHNFPVVVDIRRRFPQAAIDWAVEEAYVPLVQLSVGVRRAVPVAIRRWRKGLLGMTTWQEIAELRRMLQAERYDEVIDTQGLLKSALITAAAQGRRHGFDAHSAREPIAARFYDVVHHVARGQHAVSRNRQLVAAALGYRASEPVAYGLRARTQTGGEVVLLHSTSRADKHWAESSWIELARRLHDAGSKVVLPWATPLEQERSRRIASSLPGARVPPSMPLAAMAAQLTAAKAVVGVDTGLVHLAAALGRPAVAIYCATDPRLTGIHGSSRAANLGSPGHAPAPDQVFEALQGLGAL